MRTPLVIVGAGGFGRETLDIVDSINHKSGDSTYDVVGFLDDGEPDLNRLRRLGGVRHLGGLKAAESVLPDSCRYVVAIANPDVREAISNRLDRHGFRAETLIHPSATVGRDVMVGNGSVLCAGVRVTTNVRIGRHVIINLNSTIGHDTTLSDYVSINPLVAISGDVMLHRGVTMGTGSTINQGLSIGAGTTVGAGAAVVKDQAGGLVVAGVPARALIAKSTNA